MKSYHGLCFSYFHLHSREIGSRRFKVLRSLFKNGGIELDIIAGNYPGVDPEDGVITAGNISPFCSTINWLSRLKRRLSGKHFQERGPSINQSIYRESRDLPEITRSKSMRSFINSFCQLPDPYAGWIIPVILKMIRRREKYDFIISTAPPWSSHLAAVFLGRLLNIPVILDDRDPWADSIGRMAIITHPLMRSIDKLIADYCYSKAAGIVSVTEAACKLHKEKLGEDSLPIEYIPNGFDPILDQYYRPSGRRDKITIIHVGSTYHGRSPMIILAAAAALEKPIAEDFHFRFIGRISQGEINTINSMDKRFRVTIDGFKDHEYCIKAILDSDICLLIAIGQPMQIPCKLYEYIGLGRPVLALSEEKDATMNLLEKKEWAWTVTADNKDNLTQALRDIHRLWKIDDLPYSAIEKERNEFRFDVAADRYIRFSREVAERARIKKE